MRKFLFGMHLGSCLAALFATGVGAAAGCAGPSTHIDNPGGHRCFVDGALESRRDLPFRYYGTTRIDATPADAGGRADFSRQPISLAVPMPAPASPWLFPLDLPLELVQWVFRGQPPTHAAVALPPTPPELRVAPDFRPTGLALISERALQARIAR